MRTHFPLTVSLVALLALLTDSNKGYGQSSAPSSRPNVIIVITDDQGYGDMSCHGNPWLKTPNIDRLHSESTRFTDFHVSPTCAPTRAALMTGHVSNRTGVWHTIAGRSLLRESEMTMAEVFSENGYATGMFGKWHLGDNYPFRPQDRGFKEVVTHGGGGVGQGPDYWDNDYFDDSYFHNGKTEKYAGYCTDVWFDQAIAFMDRNAEEGEPFFCYLSTNAPHGPFFVEERYVAPFRNNESIPNPEFNGMIANFDENLGRLLRFLDRRNLAENTLLIFMTDNGTSSGVKFNGDKLEKGYNAGMRGLKGSMYEGGHRVPCFMRWPAGNISAGRDINDLAAHVDLLPTFIDLLSLKVSRPVAFDGISLKPVLTGQAGSVPLRTLITDSQRIERPEKWRRSAVMRGSWRLINGTELYDIQKDPGQTRDVAAENPKIVKQLRQDYERWWRDISPVFEEAPAIALCAPQEPVTVIRSHDMHADEGYELVPWNHQLVRNGMKASGWYSVQVPEAGTYRFNLMRWAPEAPAKFDEPLPPRQALKGTTVTAGNEGKKLGIRKAGMSIGTAALEHTIDGKEKDGVPFEVSLTAGRYQLRTWFDDGDGTKFTPYYIKVERVK